MGVLRSFSDLIISRRPGSGLLGSSEGRVADLGNGLLGYSDGRAAEWGSGLLGYSDGKVADLERGLWVISEGKFAVFGVLSVKAGLGD